MITIKAKKHDNFSVEFKFGFVGERSADQRKQVFSVNTWMFLPNSLDINPQTYGKDQFYRDIKSNVRLITPVYLLRQLADEGALPFESLREAMNRLATQPAPESVSYYEGQIKMFAAIFKSAQRNHATLIQQTSVVGDVVALTSDFVRQTRAIVAGYRGLYQIINVPTVSVEWRNYYHFGNEIMSHIIDVHGIKIIKKLDSLGSVGDEVRAARAEVVALMDSEKSYKESMGYQRVEMGDQVGNRELVFRYGMLKKYIESDLYIRLNKKRDGFAIEQIYYSLAAGLAMIFATSVAWFAQIKYGNITGPLFVVLVVSYMLKDRIKDLMRYYFAHKLGDKYFDNKAEVKIGERAVGEIKEGVDFIRESKTPKEVRDIRSRSALVEAENRIFEEKILLYRKRIVIDSQALDAESHYPLGGINEILRIHLHRLTQKMDNHEVPVDMLDSVGKVTSVRVQRIYYVNLVMQLCYGQDVDYKRFRVVMTRNGILDVEEML